ncbi:MAG: AAA family ATPase [Myxococcota bacterium]
MHEGAGSVRVHKLRGVPFVSFGVNRDALRVVCKREGNLLLMCHVGKHDPAYDWAKRHKVLQVGRHIRILRSELEAAEKGTPAASSGWQLPTGPLASLADNVFAAFGVEPGAANVFRQVPDEGVLTQVAVHLEPALGDALLSLGTDPEDLDAIETRYPQALEAKARGEAKPAPTFAEAVADEVNAGAIWKPGADDEAYASALRGEFAAWRVFLHPSQRRVVDVRARKGVVKVTGGPGTGKTVVALHRAVVLAVRHEAPVLVTTFNATLARQLGEGIDQLTGGKGPVRERIEAHSLTKVAQAVLKDAGKPHALITDAKPCWDEALAHDAAGRGMKFYASEREHVVARAGAWTETQYLKVKRTGRSHRLDRKGRREVWKVLAAFEAARGAGGGGEGVALARVGTSALVGHEVTSPYRAVICDEVQDVGASELRLLAALARDPKTGTFREDGLTLCGDGYQRIYRVPVRLSAVGIETRGRASRRLRLNYRTTEAIRRHAVATVEDLDVDELDEGQGRALAGYRSLRAGVPTEEHSFASDAEEADYIAAKAKEIADTSLLVLSRTKRALEALGERLEARGLRPRRLTVRDTPRPDDCVLLCTLHRSKGLEAPRVIIAGAQGVPARYPGGGDPADKELWVRKERSLMYVGLTRARDWCAVTRVEGTRGAP